MTTKEKQRVADPMSPEALPAHRHYDYATRVKAHLAKHAAALALIQKTLAEIADPTRTYQSSEVYCHSACNIGSDSLLMQLLTLRR
jgi:hypothetical protein